MPTQLVTDNDIFEAVRQRGFADCSIVPQRVVDNKWEPAESVGQWFLLSVAYRDGGPFEVWGRRRSRGELLELARRGPMDYRQANA